MGNPQTASSPLPPSLLAKEIARDRGIVLVSRTRPEGCQPVDVLVASLIAEGLSGYRTAKLLGVSRATVSTALGRLGDWCFARPADKSDALWVSWSFFGNGMRPVDILLLSTLLDLARSGGAGEVCPSQGWLAATLGISVRTLGDSLKRLRAAGLVSWSRLGDGVCSYVVSPKGVQALGEVDLRVPRELNAPPKDYSSRFRGSNRSDPADGVTDSSADRSDPADHEDHGTPGGHESKTSARARGGLLLPFRAARASTPPSTEGKKDPPSPHADSPYSCPRCRCAYCRGEKIDRSNRNVKQPGEGGLGW